jgi:hypothetical protein
MAWSHEYLPTATKMINAEVNVLGLQFMAEQKKEAEDKDIALAEKIRADFSKLVETSFNKKYGKLYEESEIFAQVSPRSAEALKEAFSSR